MALPLVTWTCADISSLSSCSLQFPWSSPLPIQPSRLGPIFRKSPRSTIKIRRFSGSSMRLLGPTANSRKRRISRSLMLFYHVVWSGEPNSAHHIGALRGTHSANAMPGCSLKRASCWNNSCFCVSGSYSAFPGGKTFVPICLRSGTSQRP